MRSDDIVIAKATMTELWNEWNKFSKQPMCKDIVAEILRYRELARRLDQLCIIGEWQLSNVNRWEDLHNVTNHCE